MVVSHDVRAGMSQMVESLSTRFLHEEGLVKGRKHDRN